MLNYSIGAAATGTNSSVVPGNDTWFSAAGTQIAKGGPGGLVSTGATSLGGTGTATGSIGDTTYAGGNGADGTAATISGGGGGGAYLAAGAAASGGTAGGATGAYGGAGGAGVSSNNARNSGTNYGGGGSGGCATAATNRAGGGGAQGAIYITWSSDVTAALDSTTPQIGATAAVGSAASGAGRTLLGEDVASAISAFASLSRQAALVNTDVVATMVTGLAAAAMGRLLVGEDAASAVDTLAADVDEPPQQWRFSLRRGNRNAFQPLIRR
jgi:hypothetical protein